jgi:DNA-binding beta-propeller fold protein YncE
MREAVGSRGLRRVASAMRVPRACAAMLAAIGLMLLLSASASALSQQGHEFTGSFPAPGEEGQLVDPSGVAVNETTGNIYVVDSGQNRLVEFDSAHHFLAVWGWGVKDGEKKLEVCTEKCLPGLRGHGAGQFADARSIAIDNSKSSTDPSAGDVYVEAVTPFTEGTKEFELGIVAKFDETGVLLDEFKNAKSEKFEEPAGVAVGLNGELWIYNEGTFYGFGNEAENKLISGIDSESEGEGEPGLAFDFKAGALGGFLAGHALPSGGGTLDVIAKSVLLEEENTAHETETVAVPTEEALDALAATGVASDSETGDAYVDHGTSVAAFDGNGHAIQTFGVGHITQGAGVAADAAHKQVLVASDGTGTVAVFGLEAPAAPTVDELSASGATPIEATLGALIDPHGAETEYAFRYSTGAVPKETAPCTSPCVQVGLGKLPAVFGDQPVSATIESLSPSTIYHYRVWAKNGAGGTEHLAEAEAGTEGGELTFKTQPAVLGEALPDGRQWELVSPPKKNGAAIQVMPNEGGLSQASEDGSKVTYTSEGAFGTESEPEGNRAPEVTQIVSRRGAAGWSTADIDTRHNEPEGVAPGGAQEYRAFATDLSLGLVSPFGTTLTESPPLSSEATERTPYLRNNETCEADHASCYTPLAAPYDVSSGKAFGTLVSFVAGSPDLSHVVLSSNASLTGEEAASGANLYEWSGRTLKLVSTLPSGKPAPGPALGFQNGNISDLRHAISDDGSRYIFASSFSNGFETLHSLYLRPMGQAGSIRIDEPETGVTQSSACAGKAICEVPVFQDASANGSTIFFTDEERLTHDSGATAERPDLYVCEVQEAEVEGTRQVTGCKLTDLSVAKAGESGFVQGNVVGASEDGSTAYYVADGAVAGNQGGTCRSGEVERNKEAHAGGEAQPIATTCNLYVVTRDAEGAWGTPRVVQRLSGEDEYDWGTQLGNLATNVARVSPSGEWLAFMSELSLTPPYNTRDQASDRGAEEVYLYNARTQKTVCASCNPSGARPEAILDKQDSGEGIGLLADRPLLWTSRRLSANIPSYTKISLNQAFYQSQFLSDDGRLFFNSVESLVPQDKNGKEDVYEYEPTGINTGVCDEGLDTFVPRATGCVSLISSGTASKEAAFLDASRSGQDVFFATPAQLSPLDEDTSYDVYDATICGTSGRPACLTPPAVLPPPCEETETCRPGTGGSSPTLGGSASESASSANNVSAQHEVLGTKTEEKPKTTAPKPLTRAQKLKKALAACKKLKKKSKRHSCEAQAQKKYGAKKSSKKAAHKTAFHTAGHRGR